MLCGKGNNAGDGFVIARHLAIRGVESIVVLLCPPAALTGDALTNYEILVRTRAPMVDASSIASAALPALLDRQSVGVRWIVDAMLGTGAQGPPREPFDAAIRWMNAQSARRLAIDVPSGLDCDTGRVATVAVKADATCTFVAAKPGFQLAEAAAWIGELHVASVGIPDRTIREAFARG
jgi:NAD(P)H-hydrate epimerase